MTDLDRAALDRVLPDATGQADWNDVLGRFRAHRGRRRRRLVVVAATALVVAVGTASAIGGVRDLVLHRGFIGLPPLGATPSAPESGELVLHWVGDSATHAKPNWKGDVNPPFAETLVYADGRVIWQRDGLRPQDPLQPSGYLEQRLTPEGVELLRTEVAGLLDRSRALLEPVPAADGPAANKGGLTLFVPEEYGELATWGAVESSADGSFVRLQWVAGDPHDFEDDPRSPWPGASATPEQVSALRRIDALLTDPASVLPSSAWAVRDVRAFVASNYAVCITSPTSKDVSQLLPLLPARAADLLRNKSWTRTYVDSHCAKLTTDEAREVAGAVSGLPRHAWPLALIYDIADAGTWSATMIEFDPYLPHGRFLLHGGGR